MIWAAKLSRALDVIERVTDERDRCAKARLAQTGAVPPGSPRAPQQQDACPSCNPAPAKHKLKENFYGRRCPKCGVVFPDEGNVIGGCVVCPGCKHAWAAVPAAEQPVPIDKLVAERAAKLPKEDDRLADVAQAECEKRKAAQVECEKQRAAQAGGGFMCPKCETVFLDTGFPRLPGGRGDGGPSGWRVTCPECSHEWNCLNHLPSITDRLADLEKDVRSLVDAKLSCEEDEKRKREREQAKAPVEKRCGTCGEWIENDGECGGFFLRGVSERLDGLDGPPWPNCRFWLPKEKK
jgi:uncharacterized C2H2 Zn-finger protein